MSRWTESTALNLAENDRFQFNESAIVPESDTQQTQGTVSPSAGKIDLKEVAAQIRRQQTGNLENTDDQVAATWVGSSKEASRRLARLVPQEEHAKLLDKHKYLVEKRFTTGLTRSEELDLQLIRWSLDRIDDANVGAGLDFLERIASSQENLAERITNTLLALERASYRKSK